MVATRSGLQVTLDTAVTKIHCHMLRKQHKAEGGLTCSKCTRFFCSAHLKPEDKIKGNNHPSSIWICYVCDKSCGCSECIRPPAIRKKPTKKSRKRLVEQALDHGLMSLTASNEEILKLRSEKSALEQKLWDIYCKHEHDKRVWVATLDQLSDSLRVLKQDHHQLFLAIQAHQGRELDVASEVQSLVAPFEDLKLKYHKEQAKLRKLHNELLDLKGTIRVYVRCRPLSKSEVFKGCKLALGFESASLGGEVKFLNSTSNKKFEFDHVFTPSCNQADVFTQTLPFVTSVLDGYNVCIFAYGQTATGKTFTMEGTEGDRGVNFRTVEELFRMAKYREDTYSYAISMSVLEIYNGEIRDLLSSPKKWLKIREISSGVFIIPDLLEEGVDNPQEAWNKLLAGQGARSVGSNNVNEDSSRSHCLTRVVVKKKNLLNAECTSSKLWLVDLAGSERLSKTRVEGERLKEAQSISSSLSALGDVIHALVSKQKHIPYRNSTLTRVLQDSLGGESKTLMFCCISPSEDDHNETLSSLNFASRVRGVDLGPARKQMDKSKKKQMHDKAVTWNVTETPISRLTRVNLDPARTQIVGRGKEKQTAVGRPYTSQLERKRLHLGEESRAKGEANSGFKQKNRLAALMPNVEPGKISDVVSEGLVLCGSNADHTAVEPLIVREGAKIGECVTFAGHEGKPEDVLNPKKKLRDKNLFTHDKGVATFNGIPVMTSAGACTSTFPNSSVT